MRLFPCAHPNSEPTAATPLYQKSAVGPRTAFCSLKMAATKNKPFSWWSPGIAPLFLDVALSHLSTFKLHQESCYIDTQLRSSASLEVQLRAARARSPPTHSLVPPAVEGPRPLGAQPGFFLITRPRRIKILLEAPISPKSWLGGPPRPPVASYGEWWRSAGAACAAPARGL